MSLCTVNYQREESLALGIPELVVAVCDIETARVRFLEGPGLP
jgi:hypothetical protein